MSEELLTKIKELEEKVSLLEKALVHDNLTQLKTRAFFEKKANEWLSVSQKMGEKRGKHLAFSDFSLIFFDIDHFKNINDTYGHLAGDEVLKIVSDTIRKNLRVGDVVARWGGEEIAAFLLGADEQNAKHKADEIRKAIEALTFENYPDLKLSISAGVASFEDSIDQAVVLDRADKALYRAKESGRNRVISFSELEN